MAGIHNPRFPHTCRIIRYGASTPMVDESALDDDPMLDDTELSAVNADASIETHQAHDETVIYAGICRGDNRDTISDNGAVISSYRTLALPLKQDEWTESTIPFVGDNIELQRFGYSEYGKVIDVRPGNLGTHILWNYVRN